MNRCLMNTQSSGGFTVGADSATLATITQGPGSTRDRSIAAAKASSVVTVAVAAAPIARAAASRSAPCAVAVSWPPVVP